MIRRAIALAILAGALAVPAGAQAAFGIAPGSLSATAAYEGGGIDTQAGSHPFTYTVQFKMNTDGTGKTEGGQMRDIFFEAPPGLVGNPRAVPQCPRQDFEGGIPKCKPSTQVGVLHGIVPGTGEATAPLYNLAPPPGTPLQFGFNSPSGLFGLQSGSIRTEDGYGATLAAPDIPVEVISVTGILWGTPADPGHNPERGPQANNGLPSEAPLLPFLTLPTSCASPPLFTVRVDSKQNPGAFVSASAPTRDGGGNPTALGGCEAVPFSPHILAGPTSAQAGSGAGLGFELALPNKGLLNPNADTSETEPVKTEVTLPVGVIVNPAAAGGLAACTPAQFKAASLADPGCPEAAKVGTLLVHTPLLEEAVEGSLYVASPHDNPFGSLIALYIVAKAPVQGIVVKQAGEVQIDQATGQLTTVFDGLPPIPYSSFEVRLREGARAALITPQTCGTYTTTAKLYSYAAPEEAVVKTAPFTISQGAGGGPCAPTEAQLPFAPALSAGVSNPIAGSYTPFTFKVSRADGDQRLDSVSATLPPGLTGKLAGVAECSEAQIAAAAARSNEGEGALEAASPSCPAASQLGVVNVGAGAGPTPLYVQGRAYLAGPYKGAPLSMAIITPAIAGPFDLGVVVVRAALYVNEESAQITVKSDPLPRILHGLPLDVRSAAVQIDRDQFTLNPTNCEEMAVSARLSSVTGAISSPQNRFRVGACAALAFKPKLAISLKGKTSRGGYPALKAIVTYPKSGAYANIARAQVGLPHSEFLAQENLNNVCTRPQLRSQSCPKSSIYGKAKAWSPLLDQPLEGPVYLGVGFGHPLPDLVAELNGKIRIVLHGKVDTTKEDGLRNSFEAVPDAPVSKFVLEMKGGKKYGLLRNSENVCLKSQHAEARFTAQNGRVATSRPLISNSCGGKKGS